MTLRYAQLERLLTSPASLFSRSCRRHASSSSAALIQVSTGNSGHQIVETSRSLGPAVEQLRRPKVQEYLDYVAENSHVTLTDLERFKPELHSPIGSVQYEAEYEAVVQKLDRAFTVNQLRQFLKLYGLHVSSKMKKRAASAAIIEKQWGWPSLSKSQRLARAKGEKSSRVFPLNPHQAFLLLGNDGADILSLSRTYNVHLQFSHKPLSLTVTGPTASVDQLEQHVNSLKEEIIWQDFLPPYALDLSTSSQRLSRASGCFLESLEDGNIRIWYLKSSEKSLSRAKRLIMQFAIETFKVALAASPMRENTPSPLEYAPSYAFYPFFCEPPNRTWGKRGCFRLRRVGKWFADEDQAVVENISDDFTRSYVAMTGQFENPRAQLLAQLIGVDGDSEYSVAAASGHVILSSPGSQPFSLSPPLGGQQSFSDVVNWLKEHNPDSEFIESAPMRLWQAPKPSQPWKRRLVYETIPNSEEPSQSIIFEYLPKKLAGEVSVQQDVSSDPVLRLGPVARLDVLMPDDSRDIRLTLNGNRAIPVTQWPTELLKLLEVESIPYEDVPLSFVHGNRNYLLKEDLLVQSVALPVGEEDSTVRVVNERRSDPQSEICYSTCQVVCDDITLDDVWKLFWSQCETVARDSSALRSGEGV